MYRNLPLESADRNHSSLRLPWRMPCVLLALVLVSACDSPTSSKPEKDSVDPANEQHFSQLSRDVAALRDEVAQLEANLAASNEDSRRALERENEELRRELTRLYALQLGGTSPQAPRLVPRPGADVLGLRDMLDQAAQDLGGEAAVPEEVPQADEEDSGLVTVVKEWGRTPEQASDLGADVPSLKGMICVVPPGLTEAMLTAVAGQLRVDCDAFDNINIVVFDDPDAARAYAESNQDSTAHRVLRISRERASGHDEIARVQGDRVTAIPRTP
ncbi:MAG: hypothetical protein GY851_33750 [bacterium]|nr:hypothetical protein [bacterium]